MNIRDTVIQALANCDPSKMTSLSSSVDNGAGVDIPLEFAEQFARLIINECTETVRDVLREEGNTLSYTDAGLVQVRIKSNFELKDQ